MDAAARATFERGEEPWAQWGLPPGMRLLWAFWDDEFVVFHPGSGQAHVLDVFAAEALDRIGSGSATQEDVVAALRDLAGMSLGAEEARAAAASAIRALAAQGLVREMDPGTKPGPGACEDAACAPEASRPLPAARAVPALDEKTLRRLLRGPGVVVEAGPMRFRVRGGGAAIAAHLRRCYGPALALSGALVDADLHATRARFRRVRMRVDGHAPAEPFPRRLARPYLEWAMNWAVATRLHRFLLIHAAVVEKDGRAIVLAGEPGAGKSTLSAALVAARGWRLLSDEFLLLDDAGAALPMPRPIALKEGSIAALAALAPNADLGPVSAGTPKGALVHMPPPEESLIRRHEPAVPALLVFPRFGPTAAALSPVPRARAFLRAAENAFNFGIRGAAGFNALRRMIDDASCWELPFGALEPALDLLERAAASRAERRSADAAVA